MKQRYGRTGRAISAALLATSLGACDFIEPTTADPNKVPTASVDQLFTGIQVNVFYLSQSIYARVASMWTQQTAGATSQFTALDQYVFSEEDTDDEMAAHYIGGGLIDIRRAIELADELGRSRYAGILKIYEAYLISVAADIYGDIPYTEALDPDIAEPKLDPQLEVYAALQARLDEALGDLAGSGAGPGGVDLNFGGNVGCWTAVAHSLKARLYLHVAEVQGQPAYQSALDQAGQGISSVACNFRSIHSATATETNVWHQFTRDRPDHIVAGQYLTNLLNNGTPADFADDDPRLSFFFRTARGDFAGEYIGSLPGSPAGDPNEAASPLNTAIGAAVGPAYNQPILTCSETEFIAAEAQFKLGDAAAARAAANRGIACQEASLGVELPDIGASFSGDALLTEILEAKYIALFLNMETWNDYKRTCYPNISTFENKPVPGRLLYGTTERITNTNIPNVGQQRQTPRNPNDPNPC